MPISFECDRCHRRYQVDDHLAGKRVTCKVCQHPLVIPDASVIESPPPAAELGLAVAVEDAGNPPLDDNLNDHAVDDPPDATDLGERHPVALWGDRIKAEIETLYVGQDELVRGVLIALLAEGHVLIESVPGLGKTLLVRLLGRVLGCDFNRIQFTPDLMPSDITGTSIYEEHTGEFRFRPGPIFTHLLLADEINRAPAKTHSALLEIMQEARVTIDGTTHRLDPPFLAIATQNPIESEGTYNLPEAQLDRFLFKLLIDYPGADDEVAILRLHTRGQDPGANLDDRLSVVTGPDEVLAMQRQCGEVLADDRLLQYIANLVRKTRDWPSFAIGASPRAGVAILRTARAAAALEGRSYVLPDDVIEVALPALRHRVVLTPEAEIEGRQIDELLGDLIRSVEVPRR